MLFLLAALLENTFETTKAKKRKRKREFVMIWTSLHHIFLTYSLVRNEVLCISKCSDQLLTSLSFTIHNCWRWWLVNYQTTTIWLLSICQFCLNNQNFIRLFFLTLSAAMVAHYWFPHILRMKIWPSIRMWLLFSSCEFLSCCCYKQPKHATTF